MDSRHEHHSLVRSRSESRFRIIWIYTRAGAAERAYEPDDRRSGSGNDEHHAEQLNHPGYGGRFAADDPIKCEVSGPEYKDTRADGNDDGKQGERCLL